MEKIKHLEQMLEIEDKLNGETLGMYLYYNVLDSKPEKLTDIAGVPFKFIELIESIDMETFDPESNNYDKLVKYVFEIDGVPHILETVYNSWDSSDIKIYEVQKKTKTVEVWEKV